MAKTGCELQEPETAGASPDTQLVEECDRVLLLMRTSAERQRMERDMERAYDVIVGVREVKEGPGVSGSGVDGKMIELIEVCGARQVWGKSLRGLQAEAAKMERDGFECPLEALAFIDQVERKRQDLSERMLARSEAGDVYNPVLAASAEVKKQIRRILQQEAQIMNLKTKPEDTHLPRRSYEHLVERLESLRDQQAKNPAMEAKLGRLLELARELDKPADESGSRSRAWGGWKEQMFELCKTLEAGKFEKFEKVLARLNEKKGASFLDAKAETERFLAEIDDLIENTLNFLRKESPEHHAWKFLGLKGGRSEAYTEWLRECNRLREDVISKISTSEIGNVKFDPFSLSPHVKELIRIAEVYAKYVEMHALVAELGIGDASYLRQIAEKGRYEHMAEALRAMQETAATTQAAPPLAPPRRSTQGV